MTIAQALRQSREVLSSKDIEDAAIEAEVLLKHALNLSREEIYLQNERELSPGEESRFQKLLERRLSGEPAVYITGHREFFGLDFEIDNRVLIPRPETELLVEEAIKTVRQGAIRFADVGTGSGVIAVSLAVNQPSAQLYAIDISPGALEMARINCRKHGVTNRITLLTGDLLEPLPEPVDVILANLPYVCQADLPAVNTHSHEPQIALDGGPDGLDQYRKLMDQIHKWPWKLKPGGKLMFEIGQGQQEKVICLLQEFLPPGTISILPDFSRIPRVIMYTRAV